MRGLPTANGAWTTRFCLGQPENFPQKSFVGRLGPSVTLATNIFSTLQPLRKKRFFRQSVPLRDFQAFYITSLDHEKKFSLHAVRWFDKPASSRKIVINFHPTSLLTPCRRVGPIRQTITDPH